MFSSVTDTLASNPVLLLFVTAAVGLAVGASGSAASRSAIAAVLFAGIAIGALDDRLVLPDAFWILGLALFVYIVGLMSGPGFLAALRRRGLAVNGLVLCAVVAARSSRSRRTSSSACRPRGPWAPSPAVRPTRPPSRPRSKR